MNCLIFTSIYIPRMNAEHTEEFIKYIMAYNYIGTVSHVDFTPVNQKPGFKENVGQIVKSAFVHFSDPQICCDESYRYNLDKTFGFIGNPEFWKDISDGKSYKLQVSHREYWLCLKNKNPVQRTMMNIHQVVENGRYLEGLIEAQEKIIQEQAEKLKELEKNMDNMRSVVYQLVSGLFNKETQRGIQKLHDDILFGSDKLNHDFKDENKWGIYPTTLQGDACEKKIAELEERLQILENDLEDHDIWKR